MQKML